MKILLQESPTCRIIQKKDALFYYIIARQRKSGFFYKTVAWLYSNSKSSLEEYVDHFNKHEERARKQLGVKQF